MLFIIVFLETILATSIKIENTHTLQLSIASAGNLFYRKKKPLGYMKTENKVDAHQKEND